MALITLATPPAGTPFAVHNPVVFQCADVIAGTTGYVKAEIVFCDLYVNNVYYKSQSATSAELLYFGAAPWMRVFRFDVQAILQEVVHSVFPDLAAFTMTRDLLAICRFKLMYRKGYKNSAGIVVFDEVTPVQATIDSPAVSGGGVATPTYLALNAVQQHEDEEELSIHLATIRTPTANNPLVWPLTSRPDRLYLVGRKQVDFFPFVCGYNAFNLLDAHGDIELCNYRIDFRVVGDSAIYTDQTNTVDPATGNAGGLGAIQLFGGEMYHLPTGIAQLRQLPFFAGDYWDQIVEYRVAIEKGIAKQIVVTPWITVDKPCTDGVRIHFPNRYGGWDGINFELIDETMKISSESWEKRRTPFRFYNSDTLQARKSDYGVARLNVRSNERIQARTHKYPGKANDWLKEVFGAPLALAVGKVTNTQKQVLFPITVIDADFPVKKSEDRWENMAVLEYAPANANNHQRL